MLVAGSRAQTERVRDENNNMHAPRWTKAAAADEELHRMPSSCERETHRLIQSSSSSSAAAQLCGCGSGGGGGR